MLTTKLKLRMADLNDLEILFHWRNKTHIIALGSKQSRVSYEEHVEWFTKAIYDPGKMLFIAELNNCPAGHIRFEKCGDRQCFVSVYLMMEYTGQGVGCEVLKRGLYKVFSVWPILDVIAEVRAENHNAAKAFFKVGFQEVTQICSRTSGYQIFKISKEKINPEHRIIGS